MAGQRERFEGLIAGVGSSSGVRVVVGHWPCSPFDAFTDAMVESPDGHRVLLAPTRAVADFVAATYVFDEVRLEPIRADVTDRDWRVDAPSLTLELDVAGRTPLGWLLRGVPRPVGASPAWCTVTDPVARVVLRGVRTRGAARQGRREYYGAHDVRAISRMRGAFDGADLGVLTPVDPPCRFGFSSTPRTPSVTSVTTTVLRA